RLIGVGSQSKKAAANDPQQRLARFKKIYNQTLQTWQRAPSLSTEPQAVEAIRGFFQRLTAILTDESRSPAPHLCLSFAASSRLYTAVSSIASTAHNEGVVREAVALFAALIDSEEEEFLAERRFAEALMTFVGKIAGSSTVVVGEDTDSEIVELLFGIAAKIRLQPEILPVWFSSGTTGRHVSAGSQQLKDFAGITQKEDFPLCYQLIDHVHHEGRIGDFARTGLLYIFESASKSQELEGWIVESDLPTLMATGLGALYSQLSRKLSVLHPPDDLPIILALSDYTTLQRPSEADSMYSPDFQLHMDTFLSYLTFWQDVLEHCKSFDVKQTLIDHFQVLFLQQLLYPSLLESSDIDGGSSVAVLTYLKRILDALDHPELVHMILNYLLAIPESLDLSKSITPRSPVAAKRRMSLMLLNEPENEDDRLNPSLFNLVDLILSSLRSSNPQTVIASLRLVAVILGKNHGYAAGTLLRVVNVHTREPQRTIGALDEEMDRYLALVEEVSADWAGLDDAYESHLRDMQRQLETHPCSAKSLAFNDSAANITSPHSREYFFADGPKEPALHHLSPDDPLLRGLLELLATFFTNDIETNLGLTDAIVTLASCSRLRLEGWLAVEPAADNNADATDDADAAEAAALRKYYLARRRPSWAPQQSPALLSVLQRLAAQLAALRAKVPDFDALVATRKQAFRIHEEISEAMAAPAGAMSAHHGGGGGGSTSAPGIASPTPQRPPAAGASVLDAGATEQVAAGRTPLSSPSPSRQRGVAASGAGAQAQAPAQAQGRRQARRDPAAARREQLQLMRDVVEIADAGWVRRKVGFRRRGGGGGAGGGGPREAQVDKGERGVVEGDGDDNEGETRQVSLGHVLTNVVVLQEFVLELVALLQVRSTLFQEVRFG
ncbi:Retinoic acid induced 16-like protein-domain-containing protein, partial [Lineolata rhizophorae]